MKILILANSLWNVYNFRYDLVRKLIQEGYDVRAVDIKPLDEWFQLSQKANNFSKDMTLLDNCFEN